MFGAADAAMLGGHRRGGGRVVGADSAPSEHAPENTSPAAMAWCIPQHRPFPGEKYSSALRLAEPLRTLPTFPNTAESRCSPLFQRGSRLGVGDRNKAR